ncbi:hypothetical protein ACGFSB_34545 [Streptomyces sp. NPDC048441]|uniref:hypothetical protein n=1 Tax=Streptomyces sp. NPDC048441 TaxID=3365552 RepID=UPI0037132F3B
MADSKGRPKKKFKPAGAQLVQGLLAGADDVANRSWLGGGQGTPGADQDAAPAAPASDAAQPSPPPRAPQPRGGGAPPQAAVPVADPGPAPDAERDTPARPTTARTRASAATENNDRENAESLPRASPGAEQSAAAARPRRQRTTAHSGQHAAVQESFTHAKLHSSTWKAFGFRISPDVLALLKDRVNADRRSSGNTQLAIGHYLDAAFHQQPAELPPELIDMARKFAMERIWETEKAQPSTFRVGPSVLEWLSNLSVALQDAGFARKGSLIVSAIVQQFLRTLEAEGPMQRPEKQVKSP